MIKKNKNIAFTLAEVLITLGIVGIVAAITIPTLMTKINEKVHRAQLQKVVSTLNQALKMVYNNTDTIYECYYRAGAPHTITECNLLDKELEKVLKISHICENNAYKKGCIPKYKGNDTILKEYNGNDYDLSFAGANCAAWFENNILNNQKTIVLQDGTIIGQYFNNMPLYIYVDVNGAKGPNKWGYDLFFLDLYYNGTSQVYFRSWYGGCDFYEKGGKTTYAMLNNEKK